MLEFNQSAKSKFSTLVIPTALLYDTKLSVIARMTAVMILELPKNSNNTPNLLAVLLGTSLTNVYEHLNDLDKCGWLWRIQLIDDYGRAIGYRYEILNAADNA